MVDFGKVMTAMVTPFTPGLEVDYDRAGELAELLVRTGSDSIVAVSYTHLDVYKRQNPRHILQGKPSNLKSFLLRLFQSTIR